jgi:cytochrome c
MKKFVLSVFVVLSAFFAVNLLTLSIANAKMIASNAKLAAQGKKLFYSKNIGTNGFSCATCHVYSAGTYINMHGKSMVIRPIKNAAEMVAKFDKMHHMKMTLRDKINMCDKFALKGHLTKNQLDALTAYVSSLR